MDDEFAKQLADALDVVLGRPGLALLAAKHCELIIKLRDEMFRLQAKAGEPKTEEPKKSRRKKE